MRTENAEREEVTINALLDGGSDITLIREGLARKLGLKGVSEVVAVTTAGGGRMIGSKRIKVVMTTPGGGKNNPSGLDSTQGV